MPQDYVPKYLSLDEIPVQVPDDYSQVEKQDALEFAEAILEIDLNKGQEFDQKDITPAHEAALKQKATCELVKGTEHPDDVALGDLEDTGSTKYDYAQNAFCKRYKELKDRIQESENEDGTGGMQVEPYSYSTTEPDDTAWRDV